MLNFEYYAPTKVIFGRGTEDRTGIEIKTRGYKKVLLHYGKDSIKKTGIYDKIVGLLKENDIDFIELGGVEPNPKIDLVREGVKICKENKVDFILAVGGGSVIDSSKAIALASVSDHDHWDFVLKKAVPTSALPIGVVLTIAAAGSEMSNSVVITNTDGMIKRGIGLDLVRPVFAVMNPEYTFSVSKYQTSCGIVDIMMHTLERYFAPTKDVTFTDRLAEGLLLSVIEAGQVLNNDLKDYEARATLMWASSISHNGLTGCGKDFFMSGHQIEHELSGMFDEISHGAGLAVLFPALCKYVYEQDIERFCQIAVRVWNIPMDFQNPKKTAFEGIMAMEQYFKSIGMPITLREFGISKDCFEELADKATFYGERKLKTFMELGKKEIIEILELAY